MITQKEISLREYNRGFHLITSVIEKELGRLPQAGLLHIFLKHTSAGLMLNENADPSVRVDFNEIFNRLVPENENYYTHTFEGKYHGKLCTCLARSAGCTYHDVAPYPSLPPARTQNCAGPAPGCGNAMI